MAKQPAHSPVDRELLSATLPHLRDAEHLADAQGSHLSLDQAYHLAGFAPECARKAALAAPWLNKPLGHELGDDCEAILSLALALDPAAARYELQNWEQRYPALADWKPTCRYDKTSTYDATKVKPLLDECWQVVIEIMAALWADGRLSLGELQ